MTSPLPVLAMKLSGTSMLGAVGHGACSPDPRSRCSQRCGRGPSHGWDHRRTPPRGVSAAAAAGSGWRKPRAPSARTLPGSHVASWGGDRWTASPPNWRARSTAPSPELSWRPPGGPPANGTPLDGALPGAGVRGRRGWGGDARHRRDRRADVRGMGERGINVIAISQGSSEQAVAVVVRRRDAGDAVRAVPRVLGLGGSDV